MGQLREIQIVQLGSEDVPVDLLYLGLGHVPTRVIVEHDIHYHEAILHSRSRFLETV